MTISMYQASIPVSIRALNNLANILEKGAAYAETKKIDPSVLINSRLSPDMFPLSKQVQVASDIVNRGAARLAGIEPPKFEDNETTFPQLIDRIQKTISHLNTFKPEQIDGSEEKEWIMLVDWASVTIGSASIGLLHLMMNVIRFSSSPHYHILIQVRKRNKRILF